TEEQGKMAREIKEKVAAETAASLPEAKIEGIAKGRLNKFFQESTLMEQAFIKEAKISVKQYLQEASKTLKATAFKRFTLNQE
ncbi:MAG: elongation factor Ts, partial [Paludibacteraceae bacterium]|nr:elongation factor Ts [Paludibacteraceae bacterium]